MSLAIVPRKRPDIGWDDLAAGILGCMSPVGGSARIGIAAGRDVDKAAGDGGASLCMLSVRSGLDALLSALALPAGSVVLASQVTIRDMATVLEAHGLRVVPVAVDTATLAVDAGALEAAWCPQARAVLVAHLFGSRMPMDPVIAFARRRGLLVLEDGAQAFTGDGWWGDPRSDVVMLSFGPIKTATALGGALLRFRDGTLRDRVQARQDAWPMQSPAAFARRVLKFMAIKALTVPSVFGLLVRALRMAGRDHDRWLGAAVRGFAGGDLIANLRHQPCAAQLRLLQRRLRRIAPDHAVGRIAFAHALWGEVPGMQVRPGQVAACHTHWVLPVLHDAPQALRAALLAAGFDATQGASNLCALGDARGVPAGLAAVLGNVVYLPACPHADAALARCLAQAITREG